MSHHYPGQAGAQPVSSRAVQAPVRRSKGLFYADLTHPTCDQPLRIALHGVRTYEEAARAAALLIPSRALSTSPVNRARA